MPHSALIHMTLGHPWLCLPAPIRRAVVHCPLPLYSRRSSCAAPGGLVADILERYRWLIVSVFAFPLAVGVGFLLSDRLDGPDPLQLDLPPEELRVYVTGAVQRPGVYPLSNGERWIDALDAAGGPAEDADLAAVDLARRVRDEETIMVPRLGHTAVSGVSQGPLMDINAATAAELETLPGIGEVRAGDIVRSRQE